MTENSENGENNEYKNELFTIFIDKMISLYNEGKQSEIEKILIGNEIPNVVYKYSKESNGAKYIDDETAIDRRLWLDSETKKNLDRIYYICKDKNTRIGVNSAIIRLWLFQQNTEMEKFFSDVKRAKSKREVRIEISIDNKTWKEIIKKSRLMGVSVNESFSLAVNLYLKQKASIYL